ncbi:MAG: biotin/lipoate A/B protein ligase family protein [Nitrospinota bacterium]|jgi:lipoate-protein ligase A|nr:biotin/lipoate A/B protein ligase family protein [Nitrospinota bacterium]HJM43026.1 biotin/lipoate A/B protein ligase family protein [Nitrospinota bacterium]
MLKWRFMNTGARDGAWNMAVDEVLWRRVREKRSPPTVRLYAWAPATLSVGYGQSIERDIDPRALERLGIPVVRRPTGGRAVLHDREVTYSVVFPEDIWELASAPILRDYAFISRGLVVGLRNLGLAATLAPAAFRPDPKDRSGACFSSTSAYEVMVRGRKIVGSAQRRGGGGVLQHGSAPLDLKIDKLCALFRTSSEGARARLAANLRKKTVSVTEALGGRPVDYEAACAAFEAGFDEAFGGLERGGLTPGEEEETKILAREKRMRPVPVRSAG